MCWESEFINVKFTASISFLSFSERPQSTCILFIEILRRLFFVCNPVCYWWMHTLNTKITPMWKVILLSVFPLPCSRLRTSCMTWYRTWMREERTWRRGSPCWRQSWRRYWVTCRLCQVSSARSSASSTGTSWRCSSSLMTNTALSAHSQCPGGGRPPQHRPPPPRAARVQGECLQWRLLPSYGRVAFIVKPYGFNKYYPNSDDRIQDTRDNAF